MRLHHRHPDADGDHPARIPDRATDLGQREEGVQGSPPFRDRLVDQREYEPVDDLVVDRLAGRQRPVQVGAGLFDGGEPGSATTSGELDGGRAEALRHGVPDPGQQSGVHPGQSAGVAEQDQRCRCGHGSRRPQEAGDVAEGELALEDVVVEAPFGGEPHGRAFRECSKGAPGRPIARPQPRRGAPMPSLRSRVPPPRSSRGRGEGSSGRLHPPIDFGGGSVAGGHGAAGPRTKADHRRAPADERCARCPGPPSCDRGRVRTSLPLDSTSPVGQPQPHNWAGR